MAITMNTVPVIKEAIVSLTVQKLKIDGKSFAKIFDIRENEGHEPLTLKSANMLFEDYLNQIELVIDAVDKMGEK